ncbi:PilZ domain-containing protein [Thetidibacter halocola]|uniref:PilZ domain-containing protein n=1 Tax=Thetidibacter halocola TaxID=2827239 RepID=A0A8J8B8L9_9RHOB|nr:PilZ domain-containing protein [Thetidibacter halocola]MBS0126361.1 PilZ domain-containing protein [Thetidibacter halocola]
MVMQMRATRWPSAWQTEIEFKDSGMRVAEIVNVSQTGLRCRVPVPVALGERARFTVVGRRIYGRVVRKADGVVALAFDTPLDPVQLGTLRQFRRLHARSVG